jgi:hypothetical protein
VIQLAVVMNRHRLLDGTLRVDDLELAVEHDVERRVVALLPYDRAGLVRLIASVLRDARDQTLVERRKHLLATTGEIRGRHQSSSGSAEEMIGCFVAWKCAVACLFGESSQQPTCPHVRHSRRCTQLPPILRQSSHPAPGRRTVLILISVTWPQGCDRSTFDMAKA